MIYVIYTRITRHPHNPPTHPTDRLLSYIVTLIWTLFNLNGAFSNLKVGILVSQLIL